jgi:hypothetical protein
MSRKRLAVFVSRAIEEELTANATSVVEILRDAGVEIDLEIDADLGRANERGTRDFGLTLLLAAAAAASVTPLVRVVLERITRHPVVVTELRLVPAESSTGEVVRSADGEPVLHWVDVHRVLNRDGAGTHEDNLNLILQAPMGLRFELSSTSREGADPGE